MSDESITSAPARPEVAVLVGLQGAGKTTFARSRFADTHVQVSKDLMRSARDKNARQQRLIAEAVAQGRSVVVDNTNVSRADRALLVAQARGLGARVTAWFLDVSAKECRDRNAARSGRGRVPDVAIWVAARRLQPPALDEGFDEVFRVRPAPEGRFDVERIGATGDRSIT